MTCDELLELIDKTTKVRDDIPPQVVKTVLTELIHKIKSIEDKQT